MWRFRDQSIKAKLTLIVMVTSTVALLLACIGFVTRDIVSFRSEKAREVGRFAAEIGTATAGALALDEVDLASGVFGGLPMGPHVLASCLFGKNGTLVTGYHRSESILVMCSSQSTPAGHHFQDGLLSLSQDIYLQGELVGSVFIASEMSELEVRLQVYGAVAGAVLLASWLAAFVISSILQRAITLPIGELATVAKEVSEKKDYAVRATKNGNDDIGLLADGFNEMLEQIQKQDAMLRMAQGNLEKRVEERTSQLLHEEDSRRQIEQALTESEEQLRQSQKMDAVGRLAGGVAHDFNNLLTGILGYSTIILSKLSNEDPLAEQVREIKKAGERAAALTRQLLAFSRKQVLEPKVLSLNVIVEGLEKMLRRLIGEHIELVAATSDSLDSVKADPGQIEQVILNLVVNARDAMPEGGQVVVETMNLHVNDTSAWKQDSPEGNYVCLAVSDTGCGIDQATQQKIFEPFFTTKEQGRGTGLGLSTVYGIVKQSGGHVSVYSEVGVGTTFKIYFPRVAEDAENIGRVSRPKEVPRGTETILLVEDEKMVRNLVYNILITFGYRVLVAPHGGEALLICETYKEPIHLMLSDVVMPNLNGGELYKRVEPIHPDMKVLFMSGYTDVSVTYQGSLDTAAPFIHKPFTPEALAQKIREVLEGAD